jgi:putative phage-type endonuclease
MNAPIQTRPDRQKFIGGSDVAAILGLSPWKTPLQLWQDKTQPAMPENVDPAKAKIFARGHRMEPYVVDLLSAESGLKIARRNARYVDPEFSFLAAEIDAEAETGENIEIKTVSPFKAADWGELGTDSIPVYYTAQAQHGMMIKGASVCVFGVLIGGDDFRIYRVERDELVIAAIRAAEVKFWREHVETLQPPPPMDAEDVARLFPRDIGTAVEADTNALIAVNELRELNVEAGEIERRIDGCKESIKRAMGDAARLTLNGKDLATWKSQSARRFDQRAFQAAHADLFEQFIKTTESRVLRLK